MQDQFGCLLFDAFCQQQCVLRFFNVAQEDYELVAADTARHVHALKAVADNVADGRQHPVAFGMAQGVVDFLEFVHVDHQEGAHVSFFVVIRQHHADQFFRGAFVQEAGQWIGLGTFFQFQLQQLLLGHVVDEGDDAIDVPVLIIGGPLDQL